MSTQPPKPQPQSDTVKTSGDIYGLGRSGGQRGAEILAGLRAISTPSPESKALSTMMGRLITRTLLSMLRNQGGVNYIFARSQGIENAIRRELAQKPDGTIVELAAGLSPRTLTIARAYPKATVVDVDQPDVVQAKRERIISSRLSLPDNLHFLSADLGVERILDRMNSQAADVTTAEGLTMYLDDEQFDFLLSNIYESLRPNGLFIGDVQSAPGIAEVMEHGGRIFSRQAGKYKTKFQDHDDVRQRFQKAGFTDVQIHLASSIAKANKLPQPVIDAGWLVSCRRPAE